MADVPKVKPRTQKDTASQLYSHCRHSSTNGYLLVQIDILDSKHLGLHRFLQELLTNSSSWPWQADQPLFASSTDLFVDDSLQL
jgi:hypothetical protein